MSAITIDGPWPARTQGPVRLWIWLALGICSWQLFPDVTTARVAYGDELDAAEGRLRRVMEGAAS